MFKISDRVKETSASTGTGSVSLGGADSGFQTFLAGIGDGHTTYYTIENFSRWEVGIGTYTQSTNSLSRDTVLRSSSGQTRISLEGVSIVFCTLAADRAFIKDPSNNIGGINGVFAESGIFDDLIVKDDLTITDVLSANSLEITTSASANSISSNSLDVDGHVEANSLSTSDDVLSSGLLTIVNTDDAGCFIHAYRDGINDTTVALHVNSSSSPIWKLGLKSTPASKSASPDHGYVYGVDGAVGIVSNDNNYTEMSSSAGLFTYHDSHVLLRASSATGVYIDGKTSSYPVLTVQGAALQAEHLQRWEDSVGTILSVVDSGGKVGILTSSPSYELDVAGTGSFETIRFSDGTTQTTAQTTVSSHRTYNNVTSEFSMLDSSDVVFLDTTAGAINVHLPTAVGKGGMEIMIKLKAGSNSGVLLASGSQTVDGQAQVPLYHTYESTTLISDNSNWFLT